MGRPSTRAAWRYHAYQPPNMRRHYSRYGDPWKLIEDRRLLKLFDRYSATKAGWALWNFLGDKLGRTGCACAARHYTLRTAIARCGKLR